MIFISLVAAVIPFVFGKKAPSVDPSSATDTATFAAFCGQFHVGRHVADRQYPGDAGCSVQAGGR